MKRLILALLLAAFTLLLYPGAAQARYTDGMNLYEYAKTQPVGYVDPSGTRILIHKNSSGTAGAVLKALKELCPCFTYERSKTSRGHFEIKIKTWKGKDAKGKERKFPYDPSNEAAKKKFCKCYVPAKETWKKLGEIHRELMSLSISDRMKNAEKFKQRIQNIAGHRGKMASCTLVARAIVGRKKIRIKETKGVNTINKGLSRISWNPNSSKEGPPSIGLGHELVHAVTGLRAGTDEYKVVGYENALRWEMKIGLRIKYGPGNEPILQRGDPLINFLKIDKCECQEDK